MAEAGADVIKVERPEGDFARSYDTAVGGSSSYFVWLNHGKRSVALDYKATSGKNLLTRLLRSADVVLQNLKPGSLQKAGIDLAALRQERPNLITCSISGYPARGPSAAKKAYDLLIQAETGLASVTGSPEAPGRVGVSICDISCGMFAYEAILGALIRRGQTGEGETIEVSLFEAMAEFMAVPYLLERYSGMAPERIGLSHPGIAPYGVFESRDTKRFILAVQNEREWQKLCAEILGRPDLLESPRTKGNAQRVQNRDFVDGVVQEATQALDYESLSGRLLAADIAHAPVSEVSELRKHGDFASRTIGIGTQSIEVPRTPGTADPETPARVPEIGEHTQEVLAELDERERSDRE